MHYPRDLFLPTILTTPWSYAEAQNQAYRPPKGFYLRVHCPDCQQHPLEAFRMLKKIMMDDLTLPLMTTDMQRKVIQRMADLAADHCQNGRAFPQKTYEQFKKDLITIIFEEEEGQDDHLLDATRFQSERIRVGDTVTLRNIPIFYGRIPEPMRVTQVAIEVARPSSYLFTPDEGWDWWKGARTGSPCGLIQASGDYEARVRQTVIFERLYKDATLAELDQKLMEEGFCPSLEHEESPTMKGKSKGAAAYLQCNAKFKTMIDDLTDLSRWSPK